MLKQIRQMNLSHLSKELTLNCLQKRMSSRAQFLERKGHARAAIYDDAAFLYLYFLDEYQMRTKKKFIKKMKIEFRDEYFACGFNEGRAELIEKVLEKFTSKGIRGKLKIMDEYNGSRIYIVSLETVAEGD